MKAVVLIVLLVALVACIKIVDDSVNETVYKTEIVNTTEEIVINETSENLSANVSQNITNVTPELSSPTEVFYIEDLSVGQQHKKIPEIQSLVGNSSCYNITWQGVDEQLARRPLEIRKEVRPEYISGVSWKVWIQSTLTLNSELIDTQTISAYVENQSVKCLHPENFSIDWDKKLARYIK